MNFVILREVHKTSKSGTMKDPKSLALAIAAPFCFGTGLTIAKPAVSHFPPMLMMLFAYGFIAMVTFVTVRAPIKTPWAKNVMICACGVTIQGALLFWAMQRLEATTINLLLQIQVPAAVLLGWLLLREKLTIRKIAGTALALAGAAIIIGLPAEKPPLLPVLAIILGGMIWALGQALVRLWGRDSGMVTLKMNALYSVPQLIIATLLLEHDQWLAIISATPLQWAALAFVVLIGFYLAYVCWFNLLRRVGLDEAAPWILLMTPVGLVAAVVVLGENMAFVEVLGACVLMAGLAIVSLPVKGPAEIAATAGSQG
jgi:O-acetylserine/cysteine efflux transporter